MTDAQVTMKLVATTALRVRAAIQAGKTPTVLIHNGQGQKQAYVIVDTSLLPGTYITLQYQSLNDQFPALLYTGNGLYSAIYAGLKAGFLFPVVADELPR